MASPKDIILEAPIGSATYNNEFGRPSIFGYFRTLEYKDYGFHKPIMLAGGIGSIKESLIKKSNPKRRKSFRARHKCATAKDKCTARYWSCRKW